MESNIVEDNSRKWAPPFFTIWTGQAFSLIGSSLVQFALIWWLTKTTGSSTVLATAALVGLLPQVFISPVAGALIDRWSRRKTMIVADGGIALATLVLVLMFSMGKVQIGYIYLLMFLRSLGGAFHYPAMAASTSLMVPKQHLSRVQGFNSVLNGGISIISAPLGALAIAFLPMPGVLAIDVFTACLAILPLLFIPVPQPALSITRTGTSSVWQDLREGLRYVWGWPGLVMILGIATIVNLVINPGFTLMPILVSQHFGGQALQLAWMDTVFGIGMVIGGLVLSTWGGFRRRILTTLVGLLGIGISTLFLGLLPPPAYILAVVAMFSFGFVNPIANGPLLATVQATVAPEMQGRVFTLMGSAASAMMPLGMIIAGPLSDALGVQIWFVAGGIITIMMAISALFIPAIMNIEQGRVGSSTIGKDAAGLATNPGD
jgi:MFS transporter, DHA3 family, macrolide efflux protein